MSQELTGSITDKNIAIVRGLIKRSQQSAPLYVTADIPSSVITDYDIFPYPRWFRGVYDNSNPIIAEREAGYRILQSNSYTDEKKKNETETVPGHVFQTACSTVKPSFVLDPDSHEGTKLNKSINDMCIVQYY